MAEGIDIGNIDQGPQPLPNLPATAPDTSNIIPRLRNAIATKGFTPKINEAVTALINSGAAKAQDFQVPQRGPLSGGDIAKGLATSIPKGLANTAITLTEIAGGVPDFAVDAAESLLPGVDLRKSLGIPEDILPAITEDARQNRADLNANFGFTPQELQELPTPIAGTARGGEILGESLLPAAGAFAKGKQLLSTTGQADIVTLGAIKRSLVDAARDPKKFAAIETAFSEASGVGGDITAKTFGENSRVFGELTAAFGLPFVTGIMKNLRESSSGLFSLSQERAEFLVGMAIQKELQKNPDFAVSLRQSQALQELIPGFKLDLVKSSRSPSLNKAADAVQFDASKLDIGNRKAVDQFAKEVQDSFNVIRSHDAAQSGLPRGESLTAEAFKTQAARVVDNELAAVSKSMDNLEQEFMTNVLPEGTGDRFTAGQAAFEKFLQIRGRADRNIKTLYDTLDGRLPLPKEVFKRMPKAYQRALRMEAAGNKPPAGVAEMVRKMKKAFRATGRKVVTEKSFDPTTLTQKTTQRLETVDPRTNSFAAVREIRSELGERAATAAREGNRDLSRRYKILLAEVNRTLDNAVAHGGLPAEQANILGEANRLRRDFGKLFEDFEGRALFAKTNQSQMRLAFEDTLNIFIKPDSQKRASSAIQNMKRIYGDSPETTSLIRNELIRRMQVMSGDGVITLGGFNRFKKQYSTAIREAGLTNEFKNIETATRTFEDNINAFGQSKKMIENSALAHITKSSNPKTFIEKAIKDRAEFQKLIAEAETAGPEANKIFKQAVVETVTNSILMKQIEAGTEKIPVLSSKVLDQMLVESGDELKQLLGNQHFSKIKTLQLALGRSDPSGAIFKGGFAPSSTAEKTHTPIASVLSLVRQIHQRVLSPQFVATNLTVNNVLALQSKVVREVWLKTMSDIDFATDLARAAKSKVEGPAVRSLFSPGFGILAGGESISTRERGIDIQIDQRALSLKDFKNAIR